MHALLMFTVLAVAVPDRQDPSPKEITRPLPEQLIGEFRLIAEQLTDERGRESEMLLEVAGLDKKDIAERTSKLASNDWSAFPPEEQRAYAYARKLSKAPWTLTVEDYQTLENDLGPAKAMSTFWWLCRGLYMTRVSDGFQLPLERENVFSGVPKK